MRYAVAIGGLVELGEPLLELVAEFVEAGFDGISSHPKYLLQLDKAEQDDLLARIDERGLAVSLHGEFDTPLEDLRKLAELLGSRLVNMTFDPELHWTSAGCLFDTKRMISYLQELDHIAGEHEFLYGVEDFPEDPWALKIYRQDLTAILDSHHFGILIDAGHFNLSVHKYGYIDCAPEEYFETLPLQLLEVHLSDNDGEEDQHLPLGRGNVDFKAVARGLRDIGFDRISTIESVPAQHLSSIPVAKKIDRRKPLLLEEVIRIN
jgi:sugar phosphate isomerase/epimerase